MREEKYKGLETKLILADSKNIKKARDIGMGWEKDHRAVNRRVKEDI